MSDFITLTCPSCGGSLQITDDIERFACAHCGKEHVVRRGGGIVSLAPVVDGIRRVEAGVDRTASELAINRLEKEIKALEKKIADILSKYDSSKELPSAASLGFFSWFILAMAVDFSFGLVVGIVVFILVIVIYEWLIAQNRKLTEPYRRQIEAKQQELEKHRQIVSQ